MTKAKRFNLGDIVYFDVSDLSTNWKPTYTLGMVVALQQSKITLADVADVVFENKNGTDSFTLNCEFMWKTLEELWEEEEWGKYPNIEQPVMFLSGDKICDLIKKSDVSQS